MKTGKNLQESKSLQGFFFLISLVIEPSQPWCLLDAGTFLTFESRSEITKEILQQGVPWLSSNLYVKGIYS